MPGLPTPVFCKPGGWLSDCQTQRISCAIDRCGSKSQVDTLFSHIVIGLVDNVWERTVAQPTHTCRYHPSCVRVKLVVGGRRWKRILLQDTCGFLNRLTLMCTFARNAAQEWMVVGRGWRGLSFSPRLPPKCKPASLQAHRGAKVALNGCAGVEKQGCRTREWDPSAAMMQLMMPSMANAQFPFATRLPCYP